MPSPFFISSRLAEGDDRDQLRADIALVERYYVTQHRISLLLLVAGIILALMFALALVQYQQQATSTPEYEEFGTYFSNNETKGNQ